MLLHPSHNNPTESDAATVATVSHLHYNTLQLEFTIQLHYNSQYTSTLNYTQYTSTLKCIKNVIVEAVKTKIYGIEFSNFYSFNTVE